MKSVIYSYRHTLIPYGNKHIMKYDRKNKFNMYIFSIRLTYFNQLVLPEYPYPAKVENMVSSE